MLAVDTGKDLKIITVLSVQYMGTRSTVVLARAMGILIVVHRSTTTPTTIQTCQVGMAVDLRAVHLPDVAPMTKFLLP